jgi:hypothetical protein
MGESASVVESNSVQPHDRLSGSSCEAHRLVTLRHRDHHLRDVLGDQNYESLARKGETMTAAAMVTYAYDQIDQARAILNAVSK